MGICKMFLVEIKLGAYKIRRYIMTAEQLDRLIQENPEYEYVKIIQEIDEKVDEPKVRKKVKDDKEKPVE